MSVSFESLAVSGVQKLQPYVPGKPVEELERELGISNSIKLASNENPLGPSPLAIDAINNHKTSINYYPDGGGFALSARIAEEHGIDVNCVTLGNGSNDILELVSRVFLSVNTSAVYSAYSFAVYPLVVQAVGAKANVAAALPENHASMPLGHDLNAFTRNINESTRVVFIANPNNPTGTWLEVTELLDFLKRTSDEVLVVLDLAYYEYMDDVYKIDIKKLLSQFKNLVITCTFSKIYALAGLRIGYALSSPDVANLLNRVRQPFNTNSLAQAAALASFGDTEHVKRSIAMNNAGKQYYVRAFAELGLMCLPTMGNFISVNMKKKAQAYYNEMLKKGVIVRPVGNYNMPDYLRITIGTEEQNTRVIQTIKEIL